MSVVWSGAVGTGSRAHEAHAMSQGYRLDCLELFPIDGCIPLFVELLDLYSILPLRNLSPQESSYCALAHSPNVSQVSSGLIAKLQEALARAVMFLFSNPKLPIDVR